VARTDIVVLGAGIVGTSIALSLVKRGLSVTLIDRGEPGRGASYGNSGIKLRRSSPPSIGSGVNSTGDPGRIPARAGMSGS
jgi:glycine/D-amino acid oxidase-like deaminating enzyme